MEIIDNIKDMMTLREDIKNIGFIPTMGALHNGHISLFKRAIEENKNTVVSIFVNPTQFLPNEDFSRYPRDVDSDIIKCQKAGVNYLFLPKEQEMYLQNEPLIKAPNALGYVLEGYSRPGHFDGVLQVVLKLLNIVRPKRAYFGKKDAQQLIIIKNMVDKLFINTEIVAADIARDSDGLALSSRNVYLESKQRDEALNISKSLREASILIGKGELSASLIKEKMRQIVKNLEVEYIEITDRELNKIELIEVGESLILVAAKVGNVRLIDNIWI